MPEYQIRARATDTGRENTITTSSKQNAIKYAALFAASPDWEAPVVIVGGKEYSGPDLRRQLP